MNSMGSHDKFIKFNVAWIPYSPLVYFVVHHENEIPIVFLENI
jgi:hypothetical protein